MPKDSLYNVIDSNLNNTVYGISNEGLIPIRKEEVKFQTEEPIDILFNPNTRAIKVTNWQIIILVISIFLLGFVKAFSNNRFNQGIKAIFNYGVALEITREEKVFFHRSNILFTVIHLLTGALFIFQLKELVDTDMYSLNSFTFFSLILAFLAGIYSVKYLFFKFFASIFNENSVAPEYIFNVSLYNNLLGFLLIIILCITYFSLLPFAFILTYIALPIILITFILRLGRLFLIGIRKGILYFYIFVYLCTLEILPLVVLYRIFVHG